MAEVIISPKNRERLRQLIAKGRTVPSVLADRIIQSKWLREMLAEAYDRGFESAELQHDGFTGVSGWVNDNPWRKK